MSTVKSIVFVPATATSTSWACLADDAATAASLGAVIRTVSGREVHMSPLMDEVGPSSDLDAVAAGVPPASPASSSPRTTIAPPSLTLSTVPPGIRRIHLTYARSGRPDAVAMVEALHALIDLDPVLVSSTCSDLFRSATPASPPDLHAVVDEEFAALARDLADPRLEGFLYRLDQLPHGDMWTFFTTDGVGDDLGGRLLHQLNDALRFRYVAQAFFAGGSFSAVI